jgi:uncharacterized protein DUF2784
MTPGLYLFLANAVLFFHLAIILFNLFGLVVIPLGAWRGWGFVRVFWWRALHLAILALVAVQAIFDQICFLTAWQSALQRAGGDAASDAPFIARMVNRLIFWPLPLWVFALIYVAVCVWAIALWWLVPPTRYLRQNDSGKGAATRRH